MAVLAENSSGKLTFGEPSTINELCIESKEEDPAALRVGAPAGEALGKISGDRLVPGSRKEKTLIILKENPVFGGFYEFYCQRPGTEDDANMVRVMRLGLNGLELFVPIRKGQFILQLQDDGNFVVYDTSPSPWRALWSWLTGAL